LLILLVVNGESLEVSYAHLNEQKPILALFVSIAPAPMLEIFDKVALEVVLTHYPNYERIHSEIHVRIYDLPLTISLRDLRRSHLNNLVRVSGVVTRRTGVFPQLKYVRFDCKKCGAVLGPFYQDSTKEIRISYCPQCESKGPFSVNSEQVGSQFCRL
jgi:DNA replication licensing factor MCM2